MTDKYTRQPLDLAAVAQRAESRPAEPSVGIFVALIYALVAHRLAMFYDEGHWLTQGQCVTLCAEWLTRSGKTLPVAERRRLADMSDQIATHIKESLSREAGLFTAHELMESLDPNHVSEIGASVMEECVRVWKNGDSD